MHTNILGRTSKAFSLSSDVLPRVFVITGTADVCGSSIGLNSGAPMLFSPIFVSVNEV